MTAMNFRSSEGICCGLFSCMEAEGLFDGVSREEKLALRQAEQAEWAFRVSRGYEKDTLWGRLRWSLRM